LESAIKDIIESEPDCTRARKWADYLRRVAKTCTNAAVAIVLAAAAMVVFALWLVAVNRGGQAVASAAGAIVTGVASGFVFRKAKQYKKDYELAEKQAQKVCG
jgi:putative flippase GtrA